MKGLVLNNFYSIRESMMLACILAIVGDAILISTGNQTALRLAFFLPIALMTVGAFEVLKQDSQSGWDKFESILPLKRQQVVQSKYVTFLLMLLFSVVVTIGIFIVSSIFVTFSEGLIVHALFRAIGIVLCVASVTYSLTYILGGDKSEVIRIVSIIFAFSMFGGISFLQKMIVGEIEGFDQLFSVNFLFVSFVIFILSYFISVSAYKRKEF
ncbi:hypothetical protein BAMA_16685 [Bacillus manliponensis]|uniref:Uncharacterized protein n=1 Tax=Bacillus manliponensis TaxID=574376 RepID=A0A073K0R4_9BACI|nr:ABC-2 transporter permease [Bacillus manliponensis]KEK20090.1 hypothetical protein BAMA_16685 [Bacillus manliponensis]